MRLISATPRDVVENSSSSAMIRGFVANDVIERFERFAFGKGLDLRAWVEALLQSGQRRRGRSDTMLDGTAAESNRRATVRRGASGRACLHTQRAGVRKRALNGATQASALRCEGVVKRYGDRDRRRRPRPRRSGAASASACSGPTAPARRRPSRSSKGCSHADAGDVEVLGRPGHGDDRALRERLGIQLQETQLAEKLTVAETLRLFRSFYPRGRRRSTRLALVELDEKRDALGRQAVGRAEAAAVGRLRAGRRSGAAVSRRADDRPRSAVAPAAVGGARGLPRRRRHHPAHDALHGRGATRCAIASPSSTRAR